MDVLSVTLSVCQGAASFEARSVTCAVTAITTSSSRAPAHASSLGAGAAKLTPRALGQGWRADHARAWLRA